MRTLILLNSGKVQHSETFIQNHINNIAFKTQNLYHYGKPDKDEKAGWLKKTQVYFLTTLNYLKFKKAIRVNKINVVLAEYGMVGADAVQFCKRMNIPIVVHFHGHDAHRKTIIEKYKSRYEKMFDYASAIVVVSKKMQQAIIDLGAPSHKVILNVYGVNVVEYLSDNVQKKQQQLFAVGRFVDKKAPYLLILSFEKVLQQFPDAKLFIAGSGYLFETCQRIINAKKLNNSIFLTGELSHSEVLKRMKESVVFLQHSVEAFDGDSEGTPNSILEASAAGLSIVATAHAGISDVIKDNITGLLVQEGDVDDMAEKIIYLLSNPDIAKNMGNQAKKNIELNYSMSDSLQKLRSILSESIGKQQK